MEIDYNTLLKISHLTEAQQDAIVREIYHFLEIEVPDWDIEGNNPNLLHQRIKLPLEILQKILYLNAQNMRCINWEYSNEYQKHPVEKYSVFLLRKLDLSELDFSNKVVAGLDLSYTNANLDPQTVRVKNLQETNCQGLDLKGKDFTGVEIEGANLKETGADIDPQTIYRKSLWGTNCQGLNLKDKDFTDVNVKVANLKGTGANLDPQTVKNKSLWNTNCQGLDLKGKDFTGVEVIGANLEETGALIDPQTVENKSLKKTNCQGLDFKGKDFTNVDVEEANLAGTGALIDPQKVKRKSLLRTNCQGLDFSKADFTGVLIEGANLEETQYQLPPSPSISTLENRLTNLILKNLEAFKRTIYIEDNEIILSFDYEQKIRKMTQQQKEEIKDLICDFTMKQYPTWNVEDPVEIQNLNRIKLPRELLQSILIDTGFYREISVGFLRRLDLSAISFKGTNLMNLDLSYTNARINPQSIYKKSLYGTNCQGLNLQYVIFCGVDVRKANLEGTNARIDPQKIYKKSLRETNCKGLNFRGTFLNRPTNAPDFTGVDVEGANLEDTNAYLPKESNSFSSWMIKKRKR